MKDLKFDTDAFVKAADEYLTLADDLETLKNELEEGLQHLVETEWVSAASKEFMDRYQDTWAQNVMEYVKFLRYLKELIINAGTEYSSLAQYIESVSFPQ